MRGYFDHMEANYWSFGPHRRPKIIRIVEKQARIQAQCVTNQCWGEYWCLLGDLQGPKKAPDTKKYKKCQENCEMVDPPGPQFDDFSVIFVSSGC